MKTEDWIEYETQYSNDYLKKINILEGITDQKMVSFRETREGLLFLPLVMVLSMKKSFFCYLI